MSTPRVLIDYLKENPDCPIEDVLNDDDLLDELKNNDDILYTYLNKNFSFLIQLLTNDITELTDYKCAFKFPFIASEVLASPHQSISSKMIEINSQTDNIYFVDLILILSKQQNINTPLPGYISKILSKNIENEELLNKLKPSLGLIYKTLFNNIDNDSCRSILLMLIKAQIEDCERKEIELCIEAIDNEFEMLNAENSDKDKTRQRISNLVYIVINIAKTYKRQNTVIKRIIMKLNSCANIVRYKNENNMSDSNSNIISIDECKCINEVMVLYSNLISIYSSIDIEKYCITSLIEYVETKIENNKMEIDEETFPLTETLNEMITFYAYMLPLLYAITLKVKQYLKKTQCIPQLYTNNKLIPISQCYLAYLDILIFFVSLKQTKIEQIDQIQSNLFIELWNDMVDYPNNSFLFLKVNKLIELIIEKENCVVCIKGIESIALNINDYLNKTIPQIKECSNKNKPLSSLNNVYLIQIYHTIVSYCKKNNIKLFKQEKDQNEILELFPLIVQKDLLKDQLQPSSDLKITNEDEETFNLEKNSMNILLLIISIVHDTEAFIFTTKKTMEASKKITAKLKAFDGF